MSTFSDSRGTITASVSDRHASSPRSKRVVLSVVLPCYNEGDGLRLFFERVRPVLDGIGDAWEIIAVNDGSSDDTLTALASLRREDNRIRVLDLSRNFGKEAALSAGLDYATGDAVVVIDADLQDPPELITEFVRKWREGFDVVYATRDDRRSDTWLKRLTAGGFYWAIRRLARIDIPPNTGDFRLMTRPVVEALRRMREHHRFMKGLFSWVGFRQTAVYFKRAPRSAGDTKFNYWRLWNFALEGITSFSHIPLQLATYVGFAIAMGAFLYGLWLVAYVLMGGTTVPGYPSLMVVMLFLSGIQLITLGIIGEYVGRIYTESKHRPFYFVRQAIGFDATDPKNYKDAERGVYGHGPPHL